MALTEIALGGGMLGLLGLGLGARIAVRSRSLDRWLVPYLRQARKRRAPRPGEPVHLFLCIADHYEPKHQAPSPAAARARVDRWACEYPRLFERFRDADGRPPRHTFFYPIEQYDAAELDTLGELCARDFGEVEIHLHHEGDTAETLRERLLRGRHLLGERHGFLSRNRATGELAYGFVHGDWALDNSHPHGKCCGVNDELTVLHETGCYADFTLPAAPDPAQTHKINSIYYARGVPGRAKAHDTGTDVGTGSAPDKALMLIQGPLLFDWGSRKWGLVPRLENGCLQKSQPPAPRRLDLWLKARVQVPTRPDWFFVKLHSHGAPEWNQSAVLGEPMVELHRELARRAAADPRFKFHYVTAREMYNLVRAAEAGWTGSVGAARDFELVPPGSARPSTAGAPVAAGERVE
jgi:hypothetical protein